MNTLYIGLSEIKDNPRTLLSFPLQRNVVRYRFKFPVSASSYDSGDDLHSTTLATLLQINK